MMQMHHFLPQFVTIVFLDDSTREKKGLLHADMSAEFQNAGEQSVIVVIRDKENRVGGVRVNQRYNALLGITV